MKDPNQLIELAFPFKGLDVSSPKSSQAGGTSIDLQNVRAYDPTTDRNRGAQRSGMTKYHEDRLNGTAPIQLIDHITLDPCRGNRDLRYRVARGTDDRGLTGRGARYAEFAREASRQFTGPVGEGRGMACGERRHGDGQ